MSDTNPRSGVVPTPRENRLVTDPRTHHAETNADRLARLRRWCVTGLLAAAELELHAWRRDTDCPPGASVLHAKLAARRGDHDLALRTLLDYETKHRSFDAELLRTLACLCWINDRHDEAGHWFGQFYVHAGHVPVHQLWIEVMDECQQLNRQAMVEPEVEQLAVELMHHVSVVPSLVVAQKLEPDAATAGLLRAALQHGYRDLHAPREQVIACEALAELALLCNDPRDARRWAHRGRRVDPFHVRFALILANIEDDAAVGPPASVALHDALRAFPHYPDLRAALIRREFAEGQTTAAQRRLQNWLHDQPDHPLALQLQQELAA